MSERIARYVPITHWLPRYQRSFLGADLLAGLAVWAVLVPQAVAYAALAGAPPEAGLFAALAAGVAYAVFGTCRELDVGPSSTIAITAAAALATVAAKFPAQDYVTLLGGARPAHRQSRSSSPGCSASGSSPSSSRVPVLIGFISGIGVVIIIGQLPKLLGLPVESGNVPETLWRIVDSLGRAGLGDAGRRASARSSRCSCCGASRRAFRGRSSWQPSRSCSAAPSISRRTASP